MGKSAYRRDLAKRLAGAGISATLGNTSKGHVRCVIEGPLGRATVYTSGTPSDVRTIHNFIAEAARAARSLGIIKS